MFNKITGPCIVATLSFCFVSQDTSLAQSSDQPSRERALNVFYPELGGNGILFSANYERLLTDNLGIRFGAGTVLVGITAPVMVNFYAGSNHKFEFGAGITYATGEFIVKFDEIILTATIGYRYPPANQGSVFRIGFTPLYNPATEKFTPWIGLSFGKVY